MLCVKNGLIHDGIHREAFIGDILVENGKIRAIGEALEVPEGAEIIDGSGLQVYPGFVEAHGHIGLDGYGIGYEGMDYNEMNDIISPQMRGIDGVKPLDPALPEGARRLCEGDCRVFRPDLPAAVGDEFRNPYGAGACQQLWACHYGGFCGGGENRRVCLYAGAGLWECIFHFHCPEFRGETKRAHPGRLEGGCDCCSAV